MFGLEHPEIAIDLQALARLYDEQGRYQQAEPLYQRALAIYERVRGHDHPETVKARENYDNLLQKRKQEIE